MLVRNPLTVEDRCPRRWSLLAGVLLLSLAVVGAGVGLSRAASADDKKTDDKPAAKDPAAKPEEKKPEKKKDKDAEPGIDDIDDLLKRLPPGLDEDAKRIFRQQLEMSRRLMEQMRKQGQAFPGFPAFPEFDAPVPLPPFPQFQPGFNRRSGFASRGGVEPRLGAMLTKPSGAMVDQLDLPREQGLVIEELRDDSAAAKAGLKRHDILLELDGKAVPSDLGEFHRQLADVKSDKAVDAVVLRKSKKETVKGLKLPEAKSEKFGLPQFGRPLFPLPQPFGGDLGGLGGITTINRTNDSFTATNRDNGVTITVQGAVADGKLKVNEIVVDDGKQKQTYDSVTKVPAEHKEKVQGLIRAGEGGRIPNVRPRQEPKDL